MKDYEQLKALCERRKSYRKFSDEPVSPDFLEKIKDVAYTSPYASGRKNWKIIVVHEKDRIKELSECVRKHSHDLSAEVSEEFRDNFKAYAKNFTFFEQAPALFIPIFRVAPTFRALLGKNLSPEISQWERDNVTKSISCVSMLILLAAESLQLGACYMTGPLLAQKEMSVILGIPQEYEIGSIIPIGYPQKLYNN